MIGRLSYDEVLSIAEKLDMASNHIKENIDKDTDDNIKKFCEEVDTYIRYLISSVNLYKASDEALKLMIEKNK